jgi:high-affinity iron transporter
MLSSFIIVFREVLEAALIIGIIGAAVRGLPHRGRWVTGGVLLGIIGASIVAAAIDTVSNMAQGNGQELFSAAVLLLAGLMLASHNIWMSHHGREIKERLSRVGADVMTGNESKVMLVTVTALAVLREGSETALFLYGIVAGDGHAQLDWISGSALGLLAGAAVGFLLFAGLSKIPLKRLFQVSGWLILFIAAGMLARGTQFLVQGGFVSGMVSPIWDTSSFISGSSILGRSLAALLGYSPAPSLTQFLVYLLSLIFIGGVMLAQQYGWTLRKSMVWVAGLGIAGVLSGVPQKSYAADYQVYSPNVVKGEKEFELRSFKSWGVHPSAGSESPEKSVKLAMGYSPTDFWATEVYVNYAQNPDESLKIEEFEWENRFQLTPQGEYWADMGLLTELEIPRYSHDPYEFKIGPMFSKDIDRLTVQLNLLAAHQYGTNAASGVELSYRSKVQYRYKRAFSPLIEAYGQPVGKIGQWGHPQHQLGGGFAGQAHMGRGENFKYSAVVLWGVSQQAADTTGVLRLEYEFF